MIQNDRFREATPTDRGRVPAQLPSDEVLWAVVETSLDAVCIIHRGSGRITYANRAAERLFGYAQDEWASLNLADLFSEADQRVSRPEEGFVESQACHRDGHLASVEWRLFGSQKDAMAVAVFRPAALVGSVADIDRDPLTGLPNRRVFEWLLKDCVDRGSWDFAVLFLDLNGFKEVNDRFGHAAGDRVLRAVAERLPRCLRPIDTVARYGGDEFVVLLKEIDREDRATAAAGRLLRAIAEPITMEGASIQISASVGIVLSGSERAEIAATIQAADRAMYRAKALGPGRYVVFDE